MTPNRKDIVEKLLKGYYLLSWRSRGGAKCYRFYDPKGNPQRNVPDATIRQMDKYIDPEIKIWKKDNAGRMTLNLSSVRRLHGKNMIKQLYKQQKKVQ